VEIEETYESLMKKKAHFIANDSCTNISKISFGPPRFKFYKISTPYLLFQKPFQTHTSTSLWAVLQSKICIPYYQFHSNCLLQSQSIGLVARYVVRRAVMLKMRGFADATTFLLLNRNSCRILEEAYSIRHNMPEDSKLPNVYFLPHNKPFYAAV